MASVTVASPAAPAAPAGGAMVPDLPTGSVRNGDQPSTTGRYIVQLWERPLASYNGGLVDDATGAELKGTSNEVTGAAHLDVYADASAAYLDYLKTRQDTVLGDINEALDSELAIVQVARPAGLPADAAYYGPTEFRYRVTLNGFAIKLSEPGTAAAMDDLEAIARVPGVMRVEPDFARYTSTDVGPEWLGAPEVWGIPTTEDFDSLDPEANAAGDALPANGVLCTATEGNHCGEMMLVGIIDTGVDPDHPSFADPAPVTDYSYAAGATANANPNPAALTNYYGVCAVDLVGVFECNDKLMGHYDFSAPESPFPFDTNGHGTHVASTAAGNVLDAVLESPTIEIPRRISGVAPHAHIISYRVCTAGPAAAVSECQLTGLVLAAEAAAIDQVDVVNMSIGGGASDPWTDPDSIAFRDLVAAGTYAAIAAGNDGPTPGTIGSPSDAPWVVSTASTTHNREFRNGAVNFGSTSPPPPADMFGKGVSCGFPQEENNPQTEPIDWTTTDCATFADVQADGTVPIVWAGDHEVAHATDPTTSVEGDCGAGAADATTGYGAEDPFPASVDFDGAIVVCVRGTYGRVAKGDEVRENGAGGYILLNDALSGDSIIADPHVLPGVHLTYADGQVLLDWLLGPDTNPDPAVVDRDESQAAVAPVGAIQGTTVVEAAELADVMASNSSRGPAPVGDVLKPDISASGVDIFAAWWDADVDAATFGFNVISGTSMASPHHAGAATLVRALQPDWTPDQTRSALMTTSFDLMDGDGNEVHDMFEEDAETVADPLDRGAGRVNLTYAPYAGFVLNESIADYTAADPNNGGDPTRLNIASLADESCVESCSWTRTLASTVDVNVTWDVTLSSDPGIALSVGEGMDPLTIGTEESADLTVTATIVDPTVDDWMFGRVTLTPNVPGIPVAHFPVAVLNTDALPPGVVLHFHGNTHDGDEQTGGNGGPCTGNGSADLAACGGPFLSEDPELDSAPAARFTAAASPVDGAAPQNPYNPNWIWRVDEPTTVKGPMTVTWWAQCGECGVFFADWVISLWVDGGTTDPDGAAIPNYSVQVTATPPLGGGQVPGLLSVELTLPELTANEEFVLWIDPVFVNSQNPTVIYYDGQGGCLEVQVGPCDSFVIMPVVGGQQATPSPTVVATASPTTVATASPSVAPTPTPTGPAPTTTATDAPPSATPTPRPTARFIPNTAFEWAIGTPEGVVTTTSLLILLGSGALLAAPGARRWFRSRR